MSGLAIPIMRWGNWEVLVRVLQYRIMQKVDDGKFDETELTEVIIGFVGDMEDIPTWLDTAADRLTSWARMIFDALGIDWEIDVTPERVKLIAEVIVWALRYLR